MSIVFCHYCNKHIDLDTDVEHFTPESELKVCVPQAEDEGCCLSCGSELEVASIDFENDEVEYFCEGCEL